ncbi:MAG TPA: hypothetical protein VI636_09775 [Candidatus Angelobacter sp.]
MSDSLDGSSISGALQSKGGMRQWMRAVNRNLLLHRNRIGAFPLSGIAGDATLTVKTPPPPVSFNVVGTDGQFQITITLPQDVQPPSVTLFQQSILADNNQLDTPMVHQLQSATSVLFDEAGNVTTYGPFSELTQTFQLPNQTLFWRIRSSFDGSNWNEWQIYSSPLFCGPVGVSSGFLRSTSGAPRMAANNTNNATVDSVDNGDGTDTIRIYGPGGVGSTFTEYDGQGNQHTIPSGTIGGAAQSTFYQVVYSTTTGFHAFPNATQYTSSIADQYYIISGSLKTVASGGAGGQTGGGGSSGGGGGVGGGGRQIAQL